MTGITNKATRQCIFLMMNQGRSIASQHECNLMEFNVINLMYSRVSNNQGGGGTTRGGGKVLKNQ